MQYSKVAAFLTFCCLSKNFSLAGVSLNQKTSGRFIQKEIVNAHNFFRKLVAATGAANMLKMVWDEEAAKQAQSYAEKCIYLQHDDGLDRKVPLLNYCSQNLMVASGELPWYNIVKGWYDEIKYFTYGDADFDFVSIGHFTQLAWAATHHVGCGSAQCENGLRGRYFNYVCHYCPMGNLGDGIRFPYKLGRPCDDCPNYCIDGLLCGNACPFANIYDCKTIEDPCRDDNCNATCFCSDKMIYWIEPA